MAEQQFKKAVKAVQQVAPGQVKARVRQIMLAVFVSMANATNALSPDDEPDDGWMSPMLSLVSDTLAWIIVLYEQYPALFAMCFQVVLLLMMLVSFSVCVCVCVCVSAEGHSRSTNTAGE